MKQTGFRRTSAAFALSAALALVAACGTASSDEGGDEAADPADAGAQHSTVPVENFRPFRDNPVPGRAEPPKAQEIYKVLDTVMSGVLTNEDADPGELLDTAEDQVNQVLANP